MDRTKVIGGILTALLFGGFAVFFYVTQFNSPTPAPAKSPLADVTATVPSPTPIPTATDKPAAHRAATKKATHHKKK